jgi:hypothetical protein
MKDIILEIIAKEGDISGREVRAKLPGKLSGPAFYQQMAKMEDEGLVIGYYAEKELMGQVIKERRYRLPSKLKGRNEPN